MADKVIKICGRCNGTGYTITGGHQIPCPDCDGHGYTLVDREVYYKQLNREQKNRRLLPTWLAMKKTLSRQIERKENMKAMTKDCPSCVHLVQRERGEWACSWGKNKKPKTLDEKRIKKRCWLREKHAL